MLACSATAVDLRAEGNAIYNCDVREAMEKILAAYHYKTGDKFWHDTTDEGKDKSVRASGYAEFVFTSDWQLTQTELIGITSKIRRGWFERYCRLKAAEQIPGAERYVPRTKGLHSGAGTLNQSFHAPTVDGKLLYLEVVVTRETDTEFSVYLQYTQKGI
ncbi:MAG: hypothetical protein AAGK14_15735 [Verrucomicrobiota bacterium]